MSVKHNGTTFFTVTEVSERLGVPRSTLLHWIRSGAVETVRAGILPKSPYLIPEGEVERIVAELNFTGEGGS